MRVFAWIGVAALAIGIWFAAGPEERRQQALVWLGLRPDPLAVATAGLEVIRAERQLVILSARFMTRQTSGRALVPMLPQGLFEGRKTLIVSGTVRYALDLTELDAGSLAWSAATQTLTIRRPPLVLIGPSFHVTSSDELEENRIVTWLTSAERQLGSENWRKARTAMLEQARTPKLRQDAEVEAASALTRLFKLPLVAAGFDEVKIVVETPGQPARIPVPSR